MNKKNRSHQRKSPPKFGFIQIYGDDGGKILNISEAGLSFETFSPLGQAKDVQFWFSLNLRDRIEAMGEVAWLDAATKVGGLRFRNPSERALKHIRNYVNELPAVESRAKGQVFAAALARQSFGQSAFKSGAPSSNHSPGFISSFTDSPISQPLGYSAQSDRPLPPSVDSTDLISLQRHLAVSRRQLFLGIFLGFLLSSVVALPVVNYLSHRNRVAPSQASNETVTSSPANFQDASTEAARGQAAAPLSQGTFTPTNSSQASATRSLPGNSPKNQMPSPPSQVPARDRGFDVQSKTVRDAAQAVAKKSSATPQQLWTAVQTGDSNAAVALADRYLRGDGVPVNCVQARVLLLVASEKNNSAAIKKLQELDKNGCS